MEMKEDETREQEMKDASEDRMRAENQTANTQKKTKNLEESERESRGGTGAGTKPSESRAREEKKKSV